MNSLIFKTAQSSLEVAAVLSFVSGGGHDWAGIIIPDIDLLEYN
jgi:hypothetical protein